MRRGMYVQYSTLEKAVVVGTVGTVHMMKEDTLEACMWGHGMMLP